MASRTDPYLSLVVTARNDNHGGDFLKRMQIFVDGFFAQAERFGLRAELIVVEWNPPVDRPRLAEALRWPEQTASCHVRILEVTPEIHRRYLYADKLPLYQMIAKNAGIRRARGRFVLATNIDLLFSDELAAFLASEMLRPDTMYRIDRTDVSADVPENSPIAEQLEFCRRNILRINTTRGTFVVQGSWVIRTVRVLTEWLRFVRGSLLLKGDLVLRRMGYWRVRVKGKLIELWRSRSPLAVGRWILGILRRLVWYAKQAAPRTPRFFIRGFFSKVVRPCRFALRMALKVVRWLLRVCRKNIRFGTARFQHLHTNACGDFTLLVRERWFKLRGYPELDMFSIHLDSVFCQMAYHGGAREKVLKSPMRLYHIEHASGWSPEESERLQRRMETLGVPLLSYDLYAQWARQMKRSRTPMIMNDEHWGLAGDTVRETEVGQVTVSTERMAL